ncbi:hypothetical protein ATANTOWER_015251 [Ataeniobius toweri]|uniref:Uncharacterized protein n=1 Tax=Ataeniobius toweri TaxID=208326 RepID=A0ABU7CKT7_9TELE|nr:hypothetical protein [Ataeniobius toweri]
MGTSRIGSESNVYVSVCVCVRRELIIAHQAWLPPALLLTVLLSITATSGSHFHVKKSFCFPLLLTLLFLQHLIANPNFSSSQCSLSFLPCSSTNAERKSLLKMRFYAFPNISLPLSAAN